MEKQIKYFFIKYSKNKELLVFLLTFIFATILLCFTKMRFPNDDQFILYRYIDNIASGNGFVFNIGERVLGATTPLFTLIAAFFKFLFFDADTPFLVACLNIIFLSFSSVYFFRLAQRFLSKELVFLSLFVFIFSMSRTIPEGMETPLFLWLVFAFLNNLFDKKFSISAVYLGLVCLTRPDAGLIAVMAFVYWLLQDGYKKAFKYTLVAVSVVVPWIIFAVFYFGSFVPQSLATKTFSHLIYNIAPLQGFKVQISSVSRIYWGRIFDPDNIFLQIIFNLVPIVFLVTMAVYKKINKNNWILFAIPFVYMLSFSISNPIIFPWYVSQMEPFWILLSLIGIGLIFVKIQDHRWKVLLMFVLLIGPASYWLKSSFFANSSSKTSAFEVSSFIKKNMNSNADSVGLADIGIVGYYTNAHILDFIGLVKGESVHFYPGRVDGCHNPTELYVVPSDLIKTYKPKFLVASDNTMDSCFIKSDWFLNNYNFVFQSGGAKVWQVVQKSI